MRGGDEAQGICKALRRAEAGAGLGLAAAVSISGCKDGGKMESSQWGVLEEWILE